MHLGQASAKSHLQTFDPNRNYAKILEEQEVYDSYCLRFKGFKVLVMDATHSEEEHIEQKMEKEGAGASGLPDHQHSHMIIKEISFEVDICKCLAKHHMLFPSQKICVAFRKPIEIILDDNSLKKVSSIMNEVLL